MLDEDDQYVIISNCDSPPKKRTRLISTGINSDKTTTKSELNNNQTLMNNESECINNDDNDNDRYSRKRLLDEFESLLQKEYPSSKRARITTTNDQPSSKLHYNNNQRMRWVLNSDVESNDQSSMYVFSFFLCNI